MSDTIYAPSTLVGRSGVTVLRVSGSRAGEALSALLAHTPLPPPRRARFRRLVGPRDGSRPGPRLGAVVSSPGQLHRRGYGRIASAWRARSLAGGPDGAGEAAGSTLGGAG